MKGFLNKVQRRVSGSGPPGLEGAPSSGGGVSVPDSKTGAAGTAVVPPSSPKSGGGLALGNVEVVPKADVTLPRKERR
jgi:hypothetical protein